MRSVILWFALAFGAGTLFAAEDRFDWSQMPTNQPPVNCLSVVGGKGEPGKWKVILDAPAPGESAPVGVPIFAVAQLAADPADEHFPMLILGTNKYGDFKFTTRFKTVDGFNEQMAGVAFRMQDERNYFYVRASSLGDSFYFYCVTKGVRSAPIGNQMKITRRVWHELSVECTGPKIQVSLDGNEALPLLTDLTYAAGKIALWTKSDSISYFTDTRIAYTPHEPFLQILVRDTVKQNPRLLDLQILTVSSPGASSRVIAGKNPAEIGLTGDPTDPDCIQRGVNYYRKDKKVVYVTMPLRDRNGDPVAAVRLAMKRESIIESQENALIRVLPIIKEMQQRAASVEKLY